MAAPLAWAIYNEFKFTFGKKVEDLSADQFKMALFLSTSNCGSVALVTAQYANLTNELANGNGYTTGGVVLAGVSWTALAGAVKTFTSNKASWTAGPGSLTFRFAVVYDNTSPNKDLVCFSLLDSTPADIVVLNGVTQDININAAGIFTLT